MRLGIIAAPPIEEGQPMQYPSGSTSTDIQWTFSTDSSTAAMWGKQGFEMPQFTGAGKKRARIKHLRLDIRDLYSTIGNAVLFLQNRFEYDAKDKDLQFVMNDLLQKLDELNNARNKWENEELEAEEK
jgi:hypothetical protein